MDNTIITKTKAVALMNEARETEKQESLEMINNLIEEAAKAGKDFLKIRIEFINKYAREALIEAGYEIIVSKGGRDEALDRWAPPHVIIYWGEKQLLEYKDDNFEWDGTLDEDNSLEIPDIEQDEDTV